ncbi:MAG: hypothetical protein WC881_02005 [Elusimicrobiota bacterium]|jgi:hypothetical protein
MKNYKWVSAQDLNRWADKTESRGLLPELIRRLVHATTDVKELEYVNFSGGEETHRPGYDGETRVKAGNAKVPAGLTFWEMGTDISIRAKLEKDYSKRVKKRGAGDFSDANYIAVTPRDYPGKKRWIDEKSALGDWHEVRLYDSDDIEQWLELAPAVGIWLSGYASRRPENICDISTHWENLKGSLKRPLPPKILLTSRQATIEAISSWLKGTPAPLAIRAESPQEVVDVFSAWVASLPLEEQSRIASRAAIIEGVDPWRVFADSKQPLIMIRAEQLELTPEQVAEAYRKGHHVLVPVSLMAPHEGGSHRLERMDRFELQEGLQKSGNCEEPEARALAQHAGGSFSVLKRKFASAPLTKTPKWSKGTPAADLAPLLLMGAWSDKVPADKAIVAKFAERPYEEVLRVLGQWRNAADAPVRWANGIWEFVSPLDAWTLLSKSLTSTQLDAFEDAARTVLGQDAPMYELPKEDRWCAQIHGKFPIYSDELREGLARSLALLAIHGASAQLADPIPSDVRANRVVCGILPAGARWQRWASLGHLLSLIAEAAPTTLLNSVEEDLRGADSELPKLFDEEGGGIGGRAEHTGLLWALERLAWAPEHLSRTALVLAKLDERDPGGRYANRPGNSLAETFCAWMPHTAASLPKRIDTVRLVIDHHPQAGWKLVLALMPEMHSAMSSRTTPEWRPWAESWKRIITNGECFQGRQGYVHLAISAAEEIPARWAQLAPDFGNIFHFNPADLDLALAALDRSADSNLASDQKRQIWSALQEQIQRHRSFSDVAWALPPAVLTKLEVIQQKLKPTDPVDIALPFFKNNYENLGDRSLSWEEQEKLRLKVRAEAVAVIIKSGGFAAVSQLAKFAGDAIGVGVALADIDGGAHESDVLPALLNCGDKALENLAFGYSARRVNLLGRSWLDKQPLKNWKPVETARVLFSMSFERSTWDYVDSLGGPISVEYWRIARYFPPDATNDVVFVTRELIGAGRPAAAIDFLAMAGHKKNWPESTVLLELFEQALQTPPTEERLLDAYEVDVIFNRLRAATDIDESRLAKLEWALLPAMNGHEQSPETLHRLLARDPNFFVEVLLLAYRAKHRDKSKDIGLAEPERQQAGRARQLLEDWHRVPGTQKDGAVNTAELADWMKAAREKATVADRKERFDILLGQAFAHSSNDTDGSWPCSAVREIFETLDSPDLERGFLNECIAKRGVHSRSPKEGGRQERALAKQYEDYAAKCDSRWPRTAAALHSVAEDYQAQARHEDAEAEAER